MSSGRGESSQRGRGGEDILCKSPCTLKPAAQGQQAVQDGLERDVRSAKIRVFTALGMQYSAEDSSSAELQKASSPRVCVS